MRVLGSLLWDDLGALAATFAQDLERLWPMARENPGKVYVGPEVDAQRQVWAEGRSEGSNPEERTNKGKMKEEL
jgi:hypothetical protein